MRGLPVWAWRCRLVRVCNSLLRVWNSSPLCWVEWWWVSSVNCLPGRAGEVVVGCGLLERRVFFYGAHGLCRGGGEGGGCGGVCLG